MQVRSLLIPISLTVCLAISGCSGSEQSQGGQGQGQRGQRGQGQAQGRGRGRGAQGASNVQVQTTTLQRISIQRQVDLSGTLIAPDRARVTSEVPGPVNEVLFEMGDEVKAGQGLVNLDPRELELALQRSESALRQTEAQLGVDAARGGDVPPDDQIAAVRTAVANREDARAQLARAQELVTKGVMPKAELDTTGTRVKVTEASYQAALENVRALKASLQDRHAAYELARKKLADAVVRAPISGSIAERTVQKGEYIRDGTQVATIVQMSPLKLVTAVQEKFAGSIRTGLSVQFSVESVPGATFDGRISAISPAVDQATRTFPVEILVSNASRKLKPGFFAKGIILTKLDQNVMAVPEQAVMTLAGVSSVYVIKQGGVVQQQNIRLGAREGQLFEVLAGLNGDEVLAASNLNELVSGIRVNGGGRGEGRGATAGDGSREGVDPQTNPNGKAPRQGGRRGSATGGSRQ